MNRCILALVSSFALLDISVAGVQAWVIGEGATIKKL